MQRKLIGTKLIGTLCVASLGAALAFASPVAAQQMRKGGGGAAAHVGAPHIGGRPHIGGGPRMGGNPGFHAGVRGGMHRGFARNHGWRGGVASQAPRVGAGRHFSGGRWAGGHHRHHWRGIGGFGVGLALGAAPYYYGAYDPYIYDGGYGDEVYAAAPDGSDASVQYCIDHFKSYDLASRTYLGYDGARHACP